MNIRGNRILFFSMELLSGIITFAATLLYGDTGLLGMALFFIAMFLIHRMPDERELTLIYKATALETSVLGAIMAIIYLKFPAYNWFHGFISFGLITRGLIGLFIFTKE